MYVSAYTGSEDSEIARTAQAMGDDDLVAGLAEGDAGCHVIEIAAVVKEDSGGGDGRVVGGAADGGKRGDGWRSGKPMQREPPVEGEC